MALVPISELARKVQAQEHFDQPHEAVSQLVGPGVEAEDPDNTGDPTGLDPRARSC